MHKTQVRNFEVYTDTQEDTEKSWKSQRGANRRAPQIVVAISYKAATFTTTRFHHDALFHYFPSSRQQTLERHRILAPSSRIQAFGGLWISCP
jgi:hypothetical protein